jgi:hypothetical protein
MRIAQHDFRRATARYMPAQGAIDPRMTFRSIRLETR